MNGAEHFRHAQSMFQWSGHCTSGSAEEGRALAVAQFHATMAAACAAVELHACAHDGCTDAWSDAGWTR